MITSICILSCALTLAQATDRTEWQISPRLSPGLELTYTGEYLEESLIPNAQHQRAYRLETNLLVLDAGVKDWPIAVMTTLSLQDGRDPAKKDGPASVRLELGKIDMQGRAYDRNKKLLDVPLKGPPTLEAGFVVPASLIKMRNGTTWEFTEEGQPTQRWQIAGAESCGGVYCVKVVGVQQSKDWGRTRADQCSWQRRDTIWLNAQTFFAQKVERVIERCAPARDLPTQRTVVRYELASRVPYPRLLFEDMRTEVLKASKFNDDIQPLLSQPGANRAKIDVMMRHISLHLEQQTASQAAPYRKAIVHLKSVLAKAQQGQAAVPHLADDPPPELEVARALGIGQRVPDFAISSLTSDKTIQFKQLQGQPVLIFFYNPATLLGSKVLTFAKKLSEQQAGGLTIMALAVTSDIELVRKQHRGHASSVPDPRRQRHAR